MLNDDVLRQLTLDRRDGREREAREERLAADARTPHPERSRARLTAAGLGYLLAARRHATS